ncbi:MAG: exosome nuclease subunit [Watsoniomyces obsoletus]|nr:MAG: exosome nuclease subunit [Watsoniomyces obsoletus]
MAPTTRSKTRADPTIELCSLDISRREPRMTRQRPRRQPAIDPAGIIPTRVRRRAPAGRGGNRRKRKAAARATTTTTTITTTITETATATAAVTTTNDDNDDNINNHPGEEPIPTIPTTPPPTFLTLPLELRRMIYEELLPSVLEFQFADTMRYLNPAAHQWVRFDEEDDGLPAEAQIFRVCRQIYDEALPMLYREAQFYVYPQHPRVVEFCRGWTGNLGPWARELLSGRVVVEDGESYDSEVVAELKELFASLGVEKVDRQIPLHGGADDDQSSREKCAADQVSLRETLDADEVSTPLYLKNPSGPVYGRS